MILMDFIEWTSNGIIEIADLKDLEILQIMKYCSIK